MFIHIVLFISYFNVGIKKKSELFLKKGLNGVCKGLNGVYNKGIETNNNQGVTKMTFSELRTEAVINHMNETRSADEIAHLRSEYNNDEDFMVFMSEQYDQSEARRIQNTTNNFYPSLKNIATF